jgi:hypothetical protein
MKKILLLLISLTIAALMFSPGRVNAQVETSFNTGVDLMSRYVWRGLNLGGSSPSIQPTLEYAAGNFTIGTWGAFSMSDGLTVQETDLYLSYNIKDMFTLTMTDYFLPDETLDKNNYFEFDEDSTGHVLEGSISFDGTEKIPFTFFAAINFWGADARKADGKKQYSTYIELGFNGTCKEIDYNLFAGFTPNSPDEEKGETGFYGNKAGFINLGITISKEIQITDKFSLPVTTSFIINPQAENVFLVFGISL